MTCIVTDTLRWAAQRGKQLDVVARYLRMRYHIVMDLASIRRRADMQAISF